MDENLSGLITPFSRVTSSTGWFEVDLSAYNVSVQKDFYIGVEWLNDYYPCIGEDSSNPNERSFDWNGTAWKIMKSNDYMIRAVVESKMPLRQVGIITCTLESEYISGGRNVTVSGSVTPIRVGVEVDVTYFRPDGSTVIRKAYTIATGEYTDSFMPDKVGSWKVRASWGGDEACEGSGSYAKEFTVSKGTSSLSLSYFYPTTITIGSSINLTGDIWPERFATIDLQYSLDEGQTWITFASVNTTSNGDYYIWTPNSIGNYKVRASWEGDEVSEGSVSPERTLTVTETIKIFWVSVAGRTFAVKVSCNSTLSDFSFNQTEKMISFQLMGISETVGYCNVSFPSELLGGPFTIWINDSPLSAFSETSNGETFLHFTFSFGSTCNVEIIGTTVIPEFQSMVLPLFMAFTLFAIILRKMKRNLK